ncbi:SANT/Myb-like DNA-binding domain-containing protein [Aspergillus undulatus]|uniref:SANT/Myb-like DNA-binding domain-containing protein n=1 Tax=Aspergillus undulatus TaxID=1810928 RepID=UPI003CCD5F88
MARLIWTEEDSTRLIKLRQEHPTIPWPMFQQVSYDSELRWTYFPSRTCKAVNSKWIELTAGKSPSQVPRGRPRRNRRRVYTQPGRSSKLEAQRKQRVESRTDHGTYEDGDEMAEEGYGSGDTGGYGDEDSTTGQKVTVPSHMYSTRSRAINDNSTSSRATRHSAYQGRDNERAQRRVRPVDPENSVNFSGSSLRHPHTEASPRRAPPTHPDVPFSYPTVSVALQHPTATYHGGVQSSTTALARRQSSIPAFLVMDFVHEISRYVSLHVQTTEHYERDAARIAVLEADMRQVERRHQQAALENEQMRKRMADLETYFEDDVAERSRLGQDLTSRVEQLEGSAIADNRNANGGHQEARTTRGRPWDQSTISDSEDIN